MEIEDLNCLMELENFNWEYFHRAINELAEAGNEIELSAVVELFEKYGSETIQETDHAPQEGKNIVQKQPQ